MKKMLKYSLLLGVVAVLALGLAAFRPFGGDADDDGTSDYTETLAEVLGISAEKLQAAEQTAREAAIAQAVEEGTITQEQADAILEGDEGMFGGRGSMPGHPLKAGGRFAFGSADFAALLADELGITAEELEAAQQEAIDLLMAQAVEDGTLSQEAYDMMKARSGLQPYLDTAFEQAYQNAIDAALEAGAITAEQAELLLENMAAGEPGFGGLRIPGGHGPGKGFPHPNFGDGSEDGTSRFKSPVPESNQG